MSDDNFNYLLIDTVLSPESILLLEKLEKENELTIEDLDKKIKNVNYNVNIEILNFHLDKFIENKIIEKTDDKLFLTKYGNKLLQEVRKVLEKFKSIPEIPN
jgi:DNA-binding transcriptional ArsR family regulator